MHLYSKARIFRLIIVVLGFFILTFSFQNCGGNFDIANLNNSAGGSEPDNSNNSSIDDGSPNLKLKTFGSGENKLCFVNINSEAVCYGYSGYYVLKSLGPVVDVAVNFSMGCGLKGDGKLICLSLSDYQISNTLYLENVKSITSGPVNICAITNENKVFCYFGDSKHQFQEITVLQGAKKIAANLCIINQLDQIQCATKNYSTNNFELENVSAEAYSEIKSHGLVGSRFCGLTRQGKLNCFDPNGSIPTNFVPVTMPQNLKPIKMFSFAYQTPYGKNNYSTCVVQEDDKTLCWGSNVRFTINPLSDNTDFDSPVEISQQPIREIIVDNDVLGRCFLNLDNTVKCTYNYQQSFANPFLAAELDNTSQYVPLYKDLASDAYRIKNDGALECKRTSRWNLDQNQPRDIDPCSATVTNEFISFGGLVGIKKMTNGIYENYWNCALRSDGKVTCWGNSSVPSRYADYSALGNKQASSMTSLGEVQGVSNAIDLVKIYNGNCILNTAGEVWCWG